ncbi:MAG: hypothetical protein FJ288_05940 [Planctomycetes bacterium]|nr:hypothetical protein [Planctomycetota bacterium]
MDPKSSKPPATSPCPPAAPPAPPADRALGVAEWVAAIALTALIAAAHLLLLANIGPLWRDEIQILNLANMPTLADLWHYNEHEAFPIFWHMVLRAWTALGPGQADFGLRVLGCIVGLGIVGLTWWSGRRAGCGVPLVALVLAGLSPTVLRYGDSIRGYGFGTFWMLLMLGVVARMARDPTRRNIVVAGAAAILAVQSMYMNAAVLLGLGLASCLAGLVCRRWRPAVALIIIGVIAAVTLLPYLDPILRQSRWNDFVRFPVSAGAVFWKFAEAADAAGRGMAWVWVALAALALGACAWGALRRSPKENRYMAVFAGAALVFAIACYAAFLLIGRVPLKAWYYVAGMALAAVLLEAALGPLVRAGRAARIVRIAAAILLAAMAAGPVWHDAHVRMTNVDRIAAQLQNVAERNDLIVVMPWWPGVTFTRYYRGEAPWTTLPDLGPLPIQRYDLFRKKMQEPEPIRPVLERMAATLASGGRVWLVGCPRFLQPGEVPIVVPPPPRGPWSEGPYIESWSLQMGYFLQRRARSISVVPVRDEGEPVSPFEHVPLLVAEGWR